MNIHRIFYTESVIYFSQLFTVNCYIFKCNILDAVSKRSSQLNRFIPAVNRNIFKYYVLNLSVFLFGFVKVCINTDFYRFFSRNRVFYCNIFKEHSVYIGSTVIPDSHNSAGNIRPQRICGMYNGTILIAYIAYRLNNLTYCTECR